MASQQPPASPHASDPTWSERTGATITRWGKTSLVVIAVAAVVVIVYWISAQVLPRWWAQVVGGQVNGSISAGIGWGLFYGFLFSFIPTLVIAQAFRPAFKGWKAKAIVVLIGLLLALPNWLTLWVVLGTNSAAHAGQRTMDVDAPFFRGWTAVGAIIGVALALFIVISIKVVGNRRAAYKEREANLTERERQFEAKNTATGAPPQASDTGTTTPVMPDGDDRV